MSDRAQLEKAEARELVGCFWHWKKTKGLDVAKENLAKRIALLTKIYGQGFNERVREHMRYIHKHELEGKHV